MSSHLVTELTNGDRVQIQFMHGKTEPTYYQDTPLGRKAKKQMAQRDYTTVVIVHWPVRKGNHLTGQPVEDSNGTLIETIVCHKNDRPNRKVARELALKKLFDSMANREDARRLQLAWEER